MNDELVPELCDFDLILLGSLKVLAVVEICFDCAVEMQRIVQERIKDADQVRVRRIDLVFYGMAEVRFSYSQMTNGSSNRGFHLRQLSVCRAPQGNTASQILESL